MNGRTLSSGAVTGAARTWLRAEGLSVLILSVILYWHSASSWWMFAGLLLVPDVSLFAYLVNPRVGGLCYNVVHSYFPPLVVGAVAILADRAGILPFIFIWTAHIGIDRFLGYGLKYPTAFKETHLGTLRSGSGKRETDKQR